MSEMKLIAMAQRLKETESRLYDTEEKLMEAERELKGFLNGETESEMRAVTARFAELIDREESRAEELETLKVDNQALVNRALRAEAELDNHLNSREDQKHES